MWRTAGSALRKQVASLVVPSTAVAKQPVAAVSTQQLRRMATELRPREQKLLEEDPALKSFKSERGKIELIKRIGDVLVIAVVAGSTYEIYYRVMEKKTAHAEESVKEA